MTIQRTGTIAIIGKPNVGKSTLMNYILGEKISITSRKPQTTRHRILGIKTISHTQMIFIDTPGLHAEHVRAMNRIMNRVARSVLQEVDVIVWMVEALHWHAEDRNIVKYLQSLSVPVILVINKIDLVKQKAELLPFMEHVSKVFAFAKVIPISAKSGLQIDALLTTIENFLPAQDHLFSETEVTDRSDRFIASEFVREKLMHVLGDEIPYDIAVSIDALEEDRDIVRISAVIWVARSGQKKIVIGHKGSVLKFVGTKARLDCEKYFEKKVLLKLWVKVRENWSDDARALKELGYDEE